MDSKSEEMFISIVTDVTFFACSTDSNPEVASLFTQLFRIFMSKRGKMNSDLLGQIQSLNTKMEFQSLYHQIFNLMRYGTLSLEWKVVVSLISQIIFQVSSMDLDSESELISLINQIVCLFNSKPDSDSELVSLITQVFHLNIHVVSDSKPTQESELLSLIREILSYKPETELTSLITPTISRFRSMNWEPLHIISFCSQAEGEFAQGKFRAKTKDVQPRETNKEGCLFTSTIFMRSATENHFHCGDCNGKNHEEYDKVPLEVKHPLHPKHSLQPFLLNDYGDTRECYCCVQHIGKMFYYCSACDYAMALDYVKKPPPVLSIDLPKWHEHKLAMFPSHASLTCNLCAITHPSYLFYVCPPCDFVAHQKCLSLPRVIRISRHPHHRISFTRSFDQGERCCRVCQRKINKDYGGYSCIKDGCSYIAHSRCATQKNVWDGVDLEGVPEEIEEVLEPFLRISDGIIQHFSHPQHQHHLRLDENTCKDYDDNKLCQACITPIYSGNFYSCMKCEFVIHEKCANLSRAMYHPIHPHRLTLVKGSEAFVEIESNSCSTCLRQGTGGLFYKCEKKECRGFKLHVQCATISEPLVHGSHSHPLFLTSKPEEDYRSCSVCRCGIESFNCVEDECDFALCFRCATLPQQVKYKHDKHMLSLSYGTEKNTMTHWCEVCEEKLNPGKWYYKCDEYCCVTLHIKCLIGEDLYMKPGSSMFSFGRLVRVQPNNQHMSRPFCIHCKKRCPFRIIFRYSGLIFCSMDCFKWH